MNMDKNAWKAYHWTPLLINIDQMLLFSLCWKPLKDYLQKYYSAIDLKKPKSLMSTVFLKISWQVWTFIFFFVKKDVFELASIDLSNREY